VFKSHQQLLCCCSTLDSGPQQVVAISDDLQLYRCRCFFATSGCKEELDFFGKNGLFQHCPHTGMARHHEQWGLLYDGNATPCPLTIGTSCSA